MFIDEEAEEEDDDDDYDADADFIATRKKAQEAAKLSKMVSHGSHCVQCFSGIECEEGREGKLWKSGNRRRQNSKSSEEKMAIIGKTGWLTKICRLDKGNQRLVRRGFDVSSHLR